MSSGVATLENSPLQLIQLRELARAELCLVLDTMPGKKVLVLDPKLTGPLGLIAEKQLLQDHGVDGIFVLTPDLFARGPAVEAAKVLYVLRPEVELALIVARHVSAFQGQKEFKLAFLPRKSITCEKVLEQEGVLQDITVCSLPIEILALDNDTLSMELDTSFRECYLDGDRTSLFYVAQSLMQMQALFGVIPNVRGKGNGARAVIEMVQRMRREQGADAPAELKSPEIDSLVILDRDCDLITPLLTQLTYEGLIDEVMGLKNTYVDLDPAMVGAENGPPGRKRPHPLNSNDPLYTDIRDLNFAVLNSILKEKAKSLQDNYDARHQAHTVNQIKDFVKKLNTLETEKQSLRIHINIAEKISGVTQESNFMRRLQAENELVQGNGADDYIDECIYRQLPLLKVLRLLCLSSLTQNGISSRRFDPIRREILHSYGYPAIFTLFNLERVGLLKRNGAASACNNGNWGRTKGNMKLMEDTDDARPTDVSYVFSGMAPLSVRLVQMAQGVGPFAAKRPKWGSMDDTLPGGPSVEVTQELRASASGRKESKKKVTLVYFLGGATFAEIAALRFMSQKDEERTYVAATTKLVNGDTLLESVCEQVEGVFNGAEK